jgi:hypothetical protein
MIIRATGVENHDTPPLLTSPAQICLFVDKHINSEEQPWPKSGST